MPQYQGVWTLEAQAQALTNQQWVTDPNFRNTTLLLQADGTGSGSQNQSFIDSSTNNFFIARFGNTTQGSFTPFGSSWSNYFNGSTDYLTAPTGSAFQFSGDFCVEGFCYPYAFSSEQSLFDTCPIGGVGNRSNAFVLVCNGATGALRIFTNGAYTTATSNTFSLNSWNHWAIMRSGTTLSIFINGVRGFTTTLTTNFSTGGCVIGRNGDAAGNYALCYLSNIRVTNASTPSGYSASNTSLIVPNSILTAISGTSFLTCQSNRFLDNSSNALAITTGGTPSVRAFGPFAPALQWTPDVVGGSGYFDGTGDYLATTTTTIASGSTAFQLEGWVYPTAISGAANIFGGISNGIELQYNTTNISINKTGVSNILIPSTPPIINAWNHILACRNTSGVISIYLNGVRQATATGNSTTFSATTANIGGTSYVTGYLSGVRFINGSNVVDPTQSSFTLPTAPVTAVTSTVNLLNFTNAGIYDGKMANNLETVGNAQVSTSPVKYGSGSMYFDGSGDYLNFPVSVSSFQFSAGAFTIEFWYFPLASLTNAGLVDTRANGSSGAGVLIRQGDGSSSGTTITCWAGNPGTTTGATQTGLVLNQWNHIAATRDSINSLRVFINGISGAAVARSIELTDSSCRIAAFVDATGSPNAANGFIDDLRITKGIARYIANFTPPQVALPRQ
jgi:hypothetical protein